jgi:hypothetical protein
MNLKLMLQKKKELESKAKGNEMLFKPTEGETVIRIVPLQGNPDNPFQELLFHYLGNKTILSPRTFGGTDPIGDFSDALVSAGNLTKDEYKEAKKFSPVLRTYVPVVVRGKEKEGVKFWAFGKTIYEQILAIINDEDYGDISDVAKGHDIKITFTPAEKSDTKFAKTEIMVRPKQSALTTDKELLPKLLNEQPVLLDMFKKWTAAEMDTFLQNYLNPPATPASMGNAAPATTVGDEWASNTTSATPTVPKDTAADFAALFAETDSN